MLSVIEKMNNIPCYLLPAYILDEVKHGIEASSGNSNCAETTLLIKLNT